MNISKISQVSIRVALLLGMLGTTGCTQTQSNVANDSVLELRMEAFLSSYEGRRVAQFKVEKGPRDYLGKQLLLNRFSGVSPRPNERYQCKISVGSVEMMGGILYQINSADNCEAILCSE